MATNLLIETRALGRAWDEVEEEARQAAKSDPKQQVVVPSPAVTAKWRTMLAPLVEEWETATAGGKEVLAAFRDTLAQVKAGK